MHRFGQRALSVLCLATNRVVDFVYAAHHRRITDWNLAVLNPPALQTCADCIHQHGAPLNNCFGFIDGTVRPIARPGTNQRILYNGHKRVYSLKFQAVAIPNGLIAHLCGPVGKNLIYSHVKIKNKNTLDLMDMNLIHRNVANGVSDIIYNWNMSQNIYQKWWAWNRKNPRIFTAIISLRELYSASQYHSQIHILRAIELPNKTAWRSHEHAEGTYLFLTFQKEENMKPGCWETLDCFPCCNIMQYPLLANHSVCMVTPPILYGYTYKPLFDRGSGPLPKCVLTIKVWVKSGFP